MSDLFTIICENANGDKLNLTDDFNRFITTYSGLNPPSAIINSDTIVNKDGSVFSRSKLNERNIVLSVHIQGDVESNRHLLYKIFRTKRYVKLYFKNKHRNVYTEGYIESIECDQFTKDEVMQISIICNDPYLKELEDAFVNDVKSLPNFHFPFFIDENGTHFGEIYKGTTSDIYYNGDTDIGFIITFDAPYSRVENPKIQDVVSTKFMKLNFTMEVGDQIVINTTPGSKSISLYRNGEKTNILSSLTNDSKWLGIKIGDNSFKITADNDTDLNLVSTIKYRRQYEAV